MRVWFTIGLFAGIVGCGGGNPKAVAPETVAKDRESHANHGVQTSGGNSSGGHANHEQMKMAVQRKLVVKADPAQPTASSPTKLVLQIQEENGTPIRQFEPLHEKLVHLIIVREGLDEFAHVHPEVDASGMITIEFAFPKSGHYRLFADHQPKGKPAGLAAGELVVAGDDKPAVGLVPNTSDTVEVGQIKAHIVVKPGDHETLVRFHLVDASGQAVADLEPYLGAMGHLVIVSSDGREYVHAHPLSDAKTAPDGAVEFAAHFPKPGIYKAWAQFQRGGSVLTVPYVMKVD
jgi:hypothetical protein